MQGKTVAVPARAAKKPICQSSIISCRSFSRAFIASRLVRWGGRIVRPMKNIGKARWAARKAQELERQASELEADRSGDWLARRRRQEAGMRLRLEASRFRAMAQQWSPSDDEDWAA